MIFDFVKVLTSNYILTILSCLLLAILAFLIFILVKNFNIRYLEMKLSTGINDLKSIYNEQRIANSIKALTKTVVIKMSWLERAEIKYVDKPLLRQLIPFANIYVVLFVSMTFFTGTFILLFLKFYHIGISTISGLCCAYVPFMVLNLRTKFLNEKIRKMMAQWVSTLNKAADVKEDIIYILESSLQTTQYPLKTYVQDCVTQMVNGLDEYEALELLSMKVDSLQFKNFILNLKQNRKHRGKIKILLENCEDEFFLLEDEYERRKITTFGSRIRAYVMMIFVIFVAYYLLKMNPDIKMYYLYNPVGQWFSALFIVLFFIAFIISTKITDFDY